MGKLWMVVKVIMRLKFILILDDVNLIVLFMAVGILNCVVSARSLSHWRRKLSRRFD